MNYIRRTPYGIEISMNQRKIVIETSINQALNKLCLMSCSTLQGRIDASKLILHTKSKVPIYINQQIVLIPTMSYRNFDCVFFNLYNILHIKKASQHKTKIIFDDLSFLIVECSQNIIDNQMNKAKKLNDYFEKESVYNQEYLIDFLS